MPNVIVTEQYLSDIADAIRGKNGSQATYTPAEMAGAIAAIDGGNPTADFSDVNFYDYDGTIRHSYTASEFAGLTALPPNPKHEGLTAQGWNWALADAKNHVAAYGKLNIGQTYLPSDGKTHLYIHLEDARHSPYLGIAVNGTATIDWGDGNTDTVTGTSLTTVINTLAPYTSGGDYDITIDCVTGSMVFVGNSTSGSQTLRKNSTTSLENRVYQNAIERVEIGSNCGIGDYAFYNCYSLTSITIPSGVTSINAVIFYNCYSLTSITIPNGVTSIGTNVFVNCYGLTNITIPNGVTSINARVFYNCYSLTSITIPNGVTSIGDNAFYNCQSLTSITIPNGVTSINANAFASCYGLGYVKFTRETPPAVANINAWTNIPTDCIIYVPRGTLTAYTTAANYPDPTIYTYVEED